MIVFVVVAWLATTCLVIAAFRADTNGGRRRGEGGSDAGGGSQPRTDPPNGPAGPAGDTDEPPWWPAFEREFRDYADRQTVSTERETVGARSFHQSVRVVTSRARRPWAGVRPGAGDTQPTR